jgi:hypothetical protein
MTHRGSLCIVLAGLWLGGCGGDDAEPTFEELDMALTGDDFECILDGTRVRRFYLTNKLGRLDEALEVAASPTGGTYPPGTLIQLVPQEAMFKRGPGWNPETNDWEFFFLDVDEEGTTIATRGAEDTVNAFGGNCFDCHREAEPQWDMVCEQGRGCEDLPLSASLIESIQQGDPRCP